MSEAALPDPSLTLRVSINPRRAKCNFLNAHVFAAADFNAYLMTCGGLPRLRELREQEFLLTPRGPGRLADEPRQTGRT